MNACFSWCVLCTFIYPVPLAHSNSTCLYFHIKSTIFVSQGKSASGDLSFFLYPYASIGGYLFTMSWSPPLWPSPPLWVWQANECPTSHLPTLIFTPQADDQGADLLRALMPLAQEKEWHWGIQKDFRQNTRGQNVHWSTQVLHWEMQVRASCRFIVKSTFSRCPNESD